MSSGDHRKRYRAEPPDAEFALQKAREIWSRDTRRPRAVATEDEDFCGFFGCGVLVFLSLWTLLECFDQIPPGGEVCHLMWTLMFLKIYARNTVLSSLAGGVDPDTYMKWVWLFLDDIVYLNCHVIIWKNRLKLDRGNDCLTSVDCTDCRIPNHGPDFASHKFNKKSGLRPMYIKCPAGFANPEETLFMQQRVRNRQETINERVKNWKAIDGMWRHEITRHGDAFRAILIVSQLAINSGERLFPCRYRDPPYHGPGGEMDLDDDGL
ncbi:unknown protein [Seminavis robusta]|uniref:DDE Tnp4 domain-containing protein n=1 Tax=Seminavis robusta TaxID=568900 RepID=A0A9N8I0J5_9STRA|nr:unknown protein [Seminavis robusta]|eukprot:Sro2732_g335750.1 n/a (266) ;mRNA; r:7044-7911